MKCAYKYIKEFKANKTTAHIDRDNAQFRFRTIRKLRKMESKQRMHNGGKQREKTHFWAKRAIQYACFAMLYFINFYYFQMRKTAKTQPKPALNNQRDHLNAYTEKHVYTYRCMLDRERERKKNSTQCLCATKHAQHQTS